MRRLTAAALAIEALAMLAAAHPASATPGPARAPLAARQAAHVAVLALAADRRAHPTAHAWRAWCRLANRPQGMRCVLHWQLRHDHHRLYIVTGYTHGQARFRPIGPERVDRTTP